MFADAAACNAYLNLDNAGELRLQRRLMLVFLLLAGDGQPDDHLSGVFASSRSARSHAGIRLGAVVVDKVA